jgi:hypothetical protein
VDLEADQQTEILVVLVVERREIMAVNLMAAPELQIKVTLVEMVIILPEFQMMVLAAVAAVQVGLEQTQPEMQQILEVLVALVLLQQ